MYSIDHFTKFLRHINHRGLLQDVNGKVIDLDSSDILIFINLKFGITLDIPPNLNTETTSFR